MEKLDVKALALGLGTAWASCMLFVGVASVFGWGSELVRVMSSVYLGFAPTVPGAVIGALWGFLDGAIGGAIIALVYNALVKNE
jgi:hypothetical protein